MLFPNRHHRCLSSEAGWIRCHPTGLGAPLIRHDVLLLVGTHIECYKDTAPLPKKRKDIRAWS